MTKENSQGSRVYSDWEQWIDSAPRDQIRTMQDKKLARQASWVYANSPFWREKFETEAVTPEMMTGVASTTNFPFGKKEDYREAQSMFPPYGGLLCRPEKEIYENSGFIWETSGTTGEPVRFLCSQSEYYRIDVNATCRILWMAGLRPGDTKIGRAHV